MKIIKFESVWLYLFGLALFLSQVAVDGYLNFRESESKAEEIYRTDLQQLMHSPTVLNRLSTDSIRIANLNLNNTTKNAFNTLAISERRASAKAYDKSVARTDSTIGEILRQQEIYLNTLRAPLLKKYENLVNAVSVNTWTGRLNGLSIYLIMPALSLVLGNLAAKQPDKSIFKNSSWKLLQSLNWQHIIMVFSYYAEFVSCQFTQKALAIKLQDETISFYYAAAFLVCSPAFYFFATKRLTELKKIELLGTKMEEIEETGQMPLEGYEKEIQYMAILHLKGEKPPRGYQNQIAAHYGLTALQVSKDKLRLAKKLRKQKNLEKVKAGEKEVELDTTNSSIPDLQHHFIGSKINPNRIKSETVSL